MWRAPDGSGYLVGFFTAPNGEQTADFPQAVMGNTNNPVAWDRISARDLSDTHRRALCAAAAFTFGLASELWAKDEVENPHREPAPAAAPAVRAPDPAKVLAAVEHHVAESGLTFLGQRTLIQLFGHGRATCLREIPVEMLEHIPQSLTRADNIERLNEGLHPRTGEVVLVPEASDLEDPDDQSLLSLAGAAA
jgi:hypothetical protein